MANKSKIRKDAFVNIGFKTKKEALEYIKNNNIKTFRGETNEEFLSKVKKHYLTKKSNDDYKEMIKDINEKDKIIIKNTNNNYKALELAVNYSKNKIMNENPNAKILYKVEYKDPTTGNKQYRTWVEKEFKVRKITEDISDYKSDGENKLINYDIENITIETVSNTYEGYQKKKGAFFKYYNNTIIDLEKFGIYKNNKEVDYYDSCFIQALRQSVTMVKNRYENEDKNDLVLRHLKKLNITTTVLTNKMDNQTLENIIINLKNREIKIEELSKIGEKYHILFHFFSYSKDESIKTVLYGDKTNQVNYVIPICLYDKHYMIYDDIEYSNYFISNYNDINEYVKNKNKDLLYYKNIKRKLVKGQYERSATPLYSNILYTLRHLMKQDLFTQIPAEDIEHLDFNNYFDIDKINIDEKHLSNENNWRPKTYDKTKVTLECPMSKRYFWILFASGDSSNFKSEEDKLYYNEMKKIFMKYKIIVFADFESTPNEKGEHISWLCSYDISYLDGNLINNGCFVGWDCAIKLLDIIPDKSLVYFHNSKYDITFLFDHLYINKYIEKDNQLYEANVKYNDKNFKIRDTYKHIPKKLSDFKEMFALECDKEIFPYDHYSYKFVKDLLENKPHNITKKILYKELEKKDLDEDEFIDYYNKLPNDVDIEVAKKDFLNIQVDKFIEKLKCNENIIKKGKSSIDALEYSKYYCNQDVRVLKEGFLKFRKDILEHFKIDVCNHLTISSLAEQYLINEGCYDDIYEVSGLTRKFIEQSIVGGRVMSKRNECIISEEGRYIDDFDVTSLYPAAMSKMKGFAKGIGKVITNFDPTMNELYYVEIELLDEFYNRTEQKIKIKDFIIEHSSQNNIKINKDRNEYDYDFGLFNEKDDNGVLQFTNKPEKRIFVVQNEQLQDLIKYYKIELNVHYKVNKGIYFPDGYNSKINEVISSMFDERNKYKKLKNPVQEIYKLIMNSSYGKTIIKQSDYKINIFNKDDPIDKYIIKNYNRIKEIDNSYKNHNIVKEYTTLVSHYNCAHIGSHVLAQSKNIMNEVFYYSHHNGLEPLYQDTDSIHIYKDHVQYLPKEIIGKSLGLFHSDFDDSKFKVDLKINKEPVLGEIVSKRLYVLGKKMYCDELIHTGLSKEITYPHYRFKGVDGGMIEKEAIKKGVTIPQLYNKMIIDKINKVENYAEFDEEDSNKPHFKYDGRNNVCNKQLSKKIYKSKIT